MKKPTEGELYKLIKLCGNAFEIRYGYYEDYERENEFSEPIPIYPDFLKEPVYTDEGYPFVTHMQSLCEYGNSTYKEGCCSDCSHFNKGEDLIGLCICANRRLKGSPPNPTQKNHPDRLEDKL